MNRNVVGLTFLAVFSIILLVSCERNSTLSSTVTFTGSAYYGVANSSGTTNTISVVGPAASIKVTCEGHPEFTTTAADGSYSFSVNTHSH